MAEDIIATGNGQSNGDEEPIIVAQRFLNIFRQMHILTPERKASFDKMLIELPQEIKSLFKTLPGGAMLQEYDDMLEHKATVPGIKNVGSKPNTILQSAMAQNESPLPALGGGIIDSGNFAQILANSLAQSNAQIIRELQSNLPAAGTAGALPANNGHPVKLVADESFTKIISEALAEAIANTEKKRLEDNRIIANSFLELQENLSKMMEQNAQLKYISTGEAPAEAVAGFQLKNIVDDMVRAQSKFLKETTQSQKEELSSIIATAIKESQKLSTQSLIESFKKIGEENGPTPITYAASSPEAKNPLENVEQALKAQGKEFSSIISTAIKESQKNSTQTIIETIEELKKGKHIDADGHEVSPLKIEEIMKMQANLFRDIAKAQNQEFSSLISAALKESQKQSTLAIISALRQLSANQISQPYGAYPQSSIWPEPSYYQQQPESSWQTGEFFEADGNAPAAEITLPEIEESLREANVDAEDAEADDNTESDAAAGARAGADGTEDVSSETKKKKKKKKKKNKGGDSAATESAPQESSPTQTTEAQKTAASPKAEMAPVTATPAPARPILPPRSHQPAAPVQTIAQLIEKQPKPEPAPTPQPQPTPEAPAKPQRKLTMPDAIPSLPEISEVVDKDDRSDDWGWGLNTEDTAAEEEQYQPQANEWQYRRKNDEAYDPDLTNPPAAAQSQDEDWEWEYEDSSSENAESDDWEWEYEEVADEDTAETEGEDWEWEYEEVPADGTEGEDWEWEYEEVAGEDNEENHEPAGSDSSFAADRIVAASEIVVEAPFNIILMGIDDNGFKDPYIEESNETAG